MSVCPKAIRGLARARPSVSLPLPATTRSIPSRNFVAASALQTTQKPTDPDGKKNAASDLAPKGNPNVGRKRFADFELAGRVFLVTGGAQGLGLTLAEGLVEAGGKGE
jgi:hypothetical protein